jgi:hypothetical protein
VEVKDSDKHSSLFRFGIDYGRKKFCSAGQQCLQVCGGGERKEVLKGEREK